MEVFTVGSEQEPIPSFMSFESYTQLCDAHNAHARKHGIIDKAAYESAISDPTTTYILVEGQNVPAIIALRHGYGAGYDFAQCERIGTPETSQWVWVLPHDFIDCNNIADLTEKLETFEGDLFFSSEGEDDPTLQLIEALLGDKHIIQDVPLQDDGRASQPSTQAFLSFHGMQVKRTSRASFFETPKTITDIFTAYRQHKLGTRDTQLVLGEKIDTNEINDLWKLYQDRFRWLGKNHPISMEDTKEEFTAILKNALCAIKYSDQKPVCFTYLLDETRSLYWLNPRFLDNLKQSLDTKTSFLFFPGIVSNGKGQQHAPAVITLLAHAVDKAQMEAIVFFENTNLSQAFIPRIVQRAINDTATVIEADFPKVIDTTYYHLVNVRRE